MIDLKKVVIKEKNIPVFMKEDLLGILNEDEMIQEFPKEFGE